MKKNKNNLLLLEIFLTFLKISPFTFGGGFSMIPILEVEMVKKKKWIESEKIVDLFAVSQSVPGAIAVNSATFIGYHLAGIPGALVAALGMVLPTFLIIIVLAVMLVAFQNNPDVQAALKGIKPTIVALIALAAFKMGKSSVIDIISGSLCILAIVVLFVFTSLNVVFLIIGGAILGILIFKIKDLRDVYNKRCAIDKDMQK